MLMVKRQNNKYEKNQWSLFDERERFNDRKKKEWFLKKSLLGLLFLANLYPLL